MHLLSATHNFRRRHVTSTYLVGGGGDFGGGEASREMPPRHKRKMVTLFSSLYCLGAHALRIEELREQQ